jgi:putative tryptophan/tyrosine transport system substrate-binding protein
VWLVILLTFGMVSISSSTYAQQSANIPRVGWLSLSSTVAPWAIEAFQVGLRELGYVEGQNIAIDFRLADGKQELLPELAADLVRLPVNMMLASSTPAARAAKQATSTIPVIIVAVGDPVGTGLVSSLARPGGNITGLATLIPELSAKRLELLKETFPNISRVAVLYNPANPAKERDWHETLGAARALGMELLPFEVRKADDFEGAFAAIAGSGADALITFVDPVTIRHSQQIVSFAAAHSLPAMYGLEDFVGDGGLMAYGISFPDLYRRAAVFVDKILKGAKPADLPVEQPMRLELVINLKTARSLGLKIPQTVLFKADRVLQ